jgi:hypothetical protein
MNSGFWLGLILAIPLAIIGNIVTRPVEKYLDSRIRSRALRRTRITRQEYERVKRYRENREEFYEFMLRSVVFIANSTALLIFGAFGASLLLLADSRYFTGIAEKVRGPLFLISLPLLTFDFLMTTRWGRRALDMMSYKVRHFSEYESRVKPMLDSEDHEG